MYLTKIRKVCILAQVDKRRIMCINLKRVNLYILIGGLSMAKKKSALSGLVKFLDDLSPSKSNPNKTKGSARKSSSSKKKRSLF